MYYTTLYLLLTCSAINSLSLSIYLYMFLNEMFLKGNTAIKFYFNSYPV